MRSKRFRVTALVCACLMLIAMSTFAAERPAKRGSITDYGCNCGIHGSAAYTDSDEIGSISSSFTGEVWIAGLGDYESTSNSHYTVGMHSYCSDSYETALQGHIDATHVYNDITRTSSSDLG